MSLAAVSKHTQVLEKTNLVLRSKEGRDNHLTLNPAPFRDIRQWLQHYKNYWTQRLDALGQAIDS